MFESSILFYATIIFLAFFAVFLFISMRLHFLQKKMRELELKIIRRYFQKINKIPALVEIMKKYTPFTDIFSELIVLHKKAFLLSSESIYDILEGNHRIFREILFLMKLSNKIRNLQRDGNFLYLRDFVIFYENELKKEIRDFNMLMQGYNKAIELRRLTIIGLLFSRNEKIEIPS